MARNDVVNRDGSINYDTIGGFKDRLDGHDSSLAEMLNDVRGRALVVTNVSDITYNGSKLVNLKTDGTDQLNNYKNIAAYLKSIGGGTLIFPYGTFSFSQFPIYNNINVYGIGRNFTAIQALASSYTNFTYVADAPVQYVTYQDLMFKGLSSNANQHGIYIEAIDGSLHTGGLWQADFVRVTAKDFSGSQWFLEAVDVGTDDLANQFISFRQCEGWRQNNTTSRSLTIKNQAGQFNFENCQFDNSTPNGIGTNIEITDGMCNFTLLTTQNADYAINQTGGICSYIQTWMENVKYGITQTADNGVGKMSVYGGNFANVGSDGSGNGYIFSIGSSCWADLDAIWAVGTIDSVYVMASGVGSVNIGRIRSTSNTSLPAKTNHTAQLGVNGNTLDCYTAKSVIVGSGSTINTITSQLPVDSEITLIAYQGGVTISTGGNIKITANTTLNANGTITLRKIDLWGTWVVTGLYNG